MVASVAIDTPVSAIAKLHDTPTHILDLRVLRKNAADLVSAVTSFIPNATLLYSVKTNYMPLILCELKALGFGADVVSGSELDLALRLSFDAATIAFNGPYKTTDELKTASRLGILINLDSLDEANRLNEISLASGTISPVGLRVNPGISVYDSLDPTFCLSSQTSARQSKFGYSILDGQAIHAAGVIATMPAVNLEGIHCHLGSQITSSSLFLRALDVVFDFAKKARAIAPIKKINVGGGFATPGIDRQRIGPLQNLLSVFGLALPPQQSDSFCLNHLLGGIKDLIHQYDLADLQFFVEPGRLVVSDTMSLLTRVSAVKATGGLQWAIIDAGTNMAPGISPGEFHNITCVRQTDAPLTAFRVAGPLCYEADIISNSHLLPGDLHEGDYLLISDSGAYSISRATNFIRCRPPVVSWDGQTTNLCWRRESFDDVFRFSTLEVTD